MFGHKLARAWGILTLAALALLTVFSLLPAATPAAAAVVAPSRLRVVHAVPDFGAVDVYLGSTMLVSNISFFTVGDYLTVTPSHYRVRVIPAGENIANPSRLILDGQLDIKPGKVYSFVIGGSVAANNVLGNRPTDDNKAPAPGNVRLRAAHFSSNAPAVDILVNGERVIENLAFRRASGYLEVPAGTYTIGVAPVGGSPIYSTTLTIEAGKVYTAWANGLLGGAGAQAFKVTPTVDAVYPAALVRLLHAVPDAPAVDIYLDGQLTAAGVRFGDLSGYLSVYPGSYAVAIKPAGSDVTAISGTLTVEGGKVYTAAAVGRLSGTPAASLALFEDSQARPAAGRSTLRVVHLSPDAPAVDVLSGGETLLDALAFGNAQSTELAAGLRTLQVALDAGGAEVLSGPVSLPSGEGTTLFVVGLAGEAPAEQRLRLITASSLVGGAPAATFRVHLPLVR